MGLTGESGAGMVAGRIKAATNQGGNLPRQAVGWQGKADRNLCKAGGSLALRGVFLFWVPTGDITKATRRHCLASRVRPTNTTIAGKAQRHHWQYDPSSPLALRPNITIGITAHQRHHWQYDQSSPLELRPNIPIGSMTHHHHWQYGPTSPGQVGISEVEIHGAHSRAFDPSLSSPLILLSGLPLSVLHPLIPSYPEIDHPSHEIQTSVH
jgi:hypothetical protein